MGKLLFIICSLWLLDLLSLVKLDSVLAQLASTPTSSADAPLFKNPMLWQANVHNEDLIFSSKNRCLLYPRCLLFDCCDTSLRSSVLHYFEHIHNDRHNYQHRYFIHDSIEIDNSTLANRTAKMPLFNITITRRILADELASLPPTHPKAFRALEASCHFRVLYLVQGDTKTQLPQAYDSMKDMIFLSYKEGRQGDLYFPNSTFSTGRMALYLAARQLEISQGWLYDYLVFADDDANFKTGSIKLFEDFLNQWRPAIGVPGFKKYPRKEVESVSHVDFLFKGYHRETVEVLMPWVLEFDEHCIWASQLSQIIEANMIYRNHILATTAVIVSNNKHRPYATGGCNGQTGSFVNAIHSVHGSAPKNMKHCSIKEMYQDLFALFTQGRSTGMARPKLNGYHMMDTFNLSSNALQFLELTSCSNLESYHPESSTCCSIDEVVFPNMGYTHDEKAPILSTSTYNNKVITQDRVTYYFVYHDEKHVVSKKSIPFIGHDIDSVVHVSNVHNISSSKLTKTFSKCPNYMHIFAE